MASRAKSPRADEDALDPIASAGIGQDDDPDDGLVGLDADEDGPEGPDDLDEADLDDSDLDEPDLDEPDLDDDGMSGEDDETASVSGTADGDDDADDDVDVTPIVVLTDAAFDDDEDEIAAVVVDGDDDDDGIEGIRAGEFVCRRCYMAKRETQLADPVRMLCRDCA